MTFHCLQLATQDLLFQFLKNKADVDNNVVVVVVVVVV